MSDNPFERYDIDPREGPEAITARMRERIEEAGEDERAELRAVWEQLTLHPQRRLEAALDAFPETRPALGAPPPRRVGQTATHPDEIALADVILLPSVTRALAADVPERGSVLPPLADDPIVGDPP